MVSRIDEENLDRAREIFRYYQKLGVIQSGSFDGDKWELYDERKHVCLGFGFSEQMFRENAEEWICCTPDCLKQAAKAYLMFQMGSLSLQTLREISKAFCRIGESGFSQASGTRNCPNHVSGLLQIIPGYSPERDAVIEILEEAASRTFSNKSSRRELSDFQSYFRFHDALNGFWAGAAEHEKLFFFPVFLWWNLTAVLPLRPTEFLLMPRDCLKQTDKGCSVVVRRTKLKGGVSKLTYSIDGDFVKMAYPVDMQMASEIRWYLEKTADMRPSPTGALIRREACSHYKRWDKRASVETAYGYANLNGALKIFYQEVLGGRDDISMIHLGDTRHIAMMNLIISGGSPVVCMELAGHGDIDVSSNYYANMASLVECATYEMHRRNSKGSMAAVQGSPAYSLEPVKALTRIEGGWCGSAARKEMKVDDCILSVSPLGEIGDCRSCRFFRPDVQGIHLDFYDPVRGKDKVNADSWFLMKMVEAVRQGIGLKEDIKTALIRLQHSCSHYRQCLLKNMEDGCSHYDGTGKN